MQGQTELILEALGQGDLGAILRLLVRKEASEAQITSELAIDQSVTTRGLKHLRLIGLVERDSARKPYRTVFRDETRDIFDAVDLLADRVVEARAARDADIRKQDESPDSEH
jgi:DNA-binding HxlR family transcriptional regulator